MLRWNGLTGSADTAGVQAPATPLMLGGIGAGTIIGERVAYQRFIDRVHRTPLGPGEPMQFNGPL